MADLAVGVDAFGASSRNVAGAPAVGGPGEKFEPRPQHLLPKAKDVGDPGKEKGAILVSCQKVEGRHEEKTTERDLGCFFYLI